MRYTIVLTIALFIIYFSSCSTIKTNGYFKLEENRIEKYKGIFIKSPNDSDYKQIERIFGSISASDTVVDNTEIIYKTIDVDGHKAFYAVQTSDTMQTNPNIGPRHFLSASLIFYNDTVFIAPVFRKADLGRLHFSDFKYKIPPRLVKKDTILIVDGVKRLVLKNFAKSNLAVNGRMFSECLSFDIIEIWPSQTYSGKVWLQKQHGLLKWVRSTGRVDTRVL